MTTGKQRILLGGFFSVISFAFAIHSIAILYLVPAFAWSAFFAYCFIVTMYEDTQRNSDSMAKIHEQPNDSAE